MKIGIVGCGNIARNVHVPVWKKIREARVAGVCDLNEASARMMASETGAKKYESLGDLLADDNIDIIDICTPTSTHFDISIEALRAGKHVLVEKPMALRSALAKEMLNEAHRRDRRIGVVQHYLYSRGFLKLKEILAGKDLFHVEINFWTDRWVPPDHWSVKEEIGGGLLFEQGVHSCYILVGLIGQPDTLTAAGFYRLERSDFNTCDIFTSFKKGQTTGSIHISPAMFGKHTCILIGDFGEIHWDLTNDNITKLWEYGGGLLSRLLPRGGSLPGGFTFSYNRVRLGVSIAFSAFKKGLRYAMFGSREYDQYRLFTAFLEEIRNPDKATFFSSGEVGYETLRLLERIKSLYKGALKGGC